MSTFQAAGRKEEGRAKEVFCLSSFPPFRDPSLKSLPMNFSCFSGQNLVMRPHLAVRLGVGSGHIATLIIQRLVSEELWEKQQADSATAPFCGTSPACQHADD